MAERVDIRTAIQQPLGQIHQRCTELFDLADKAFDPAKHWSRLQFGMPSGRDVVIVAQEWLETFRGTVYKPDERLRFNIEFNPTLMEWWHLNRFRRMYFEPTLAVQTAVDNNTYFPFEGDIGWMPRLQEDREYHPNSTVALAQRVDLQGYAPVLGLLSRINRQLQEQPWIVEDLICPAYPTHTALIRTTAY